MGSTFASKSFVPLLLIICMGMSSLPVDACGFCFPPSETKPPFFQRHPPRLIAPPSVNLPPVANQNPPTKTPSSFGIPSITRPSPSCSVDHLKLGLCVDVLGGLIHTGLGDPVVNTCCPVLSGLLEIEAAVCLCTTIRLKLLNLDIIVPLTLTALVTCGKTIPPDFICPPLH